jgi:hypothetical protein
LGDKISEEAQTEIDRIINELTTAVKSPSKEEEIERIREVCRTGKMIKVKPVKADLYLATWDGSICLK